MLIPYSSKAEIAFQRMVMRNADGQLLFDTNSSISFTDSVIANMHSRGVVMGGYNSRITLSNVSISGLRTTDFLGKCSQYSSLTIINSSFDGLVAEGGWEIQDSSLNVTNATFSRYEAALFQVKSSNISIARATFREGFNPTQSLVSRARIGGVLDLH